jgi:hypothetical protein
MYYKVIKNNKVIDVLDNLIYLKWQDKHNIMVLSDENEAQAILSSDKNTIWHEETLYNIPVDGYDTVRIEEIDEYEYKQLKALNGSSVQEIIDNYTLLLIEGGIL